MKHINLFYLVLYYGFSFCLFGAMLYFPQKPALVMRLYGDCIWKISNTQDAIYLTFDDGPEPGVTDFVLETLEKYQARATFFCIGRQVEKYTQVYEHILALKHSVGNHTYSHPDGWKTLNNDYYKDILKASSIIQSSLFRPPYGHILPWQVSRLKLAPYKLDTILWSVVSGDFDRHTLKEKCLQNVINHTQPGSIVVFHDTPMAFEKLKYALPATLKHFTEQGFCFKAL